MSEGLTQHDMEGLARKLNRLMDLPELSQSQRMTLDCIAEGLREAFIMNDVPLENAGEQDGPKGQLLDNVFDLLANGEKLTVVDIITRLRFQGDEAAVHEVLNDWVSI